MDNREVKGEICLVVGGEASTKSDDAAEWWENISPVEHVNLLISRGFTVADAIKETAKQRQISKRELYAKYHQ